MNEGDSINWPNLIGLRLSSHKWDEAEAELYYLEQLEQFKVNNPQLKSPELVFARHILDNTPKALPDTSQPITVKNIENRGRDEKGRSLIDLSNKQVYQSLEDAPPDIQSFVEFQREVARAQYNFRAIARVVIQKLLQDPRPQARQLVSEEFNALQAEVKELREAIENKPENWRIEEQIVCLHELGIIQALHDKNPSSINAIAKALAPALNRKVTSLQPKLNTYFSKEEQSKILTPERVEKVKAIIRGARIDSIK